MWVKWIQFLLKDSQSDWAKLEDLKGKRLPLLFIPLCSHAHDFPLHVTPISYYLFSFDLKGREKKREIFHLLTHSSNARNNLGWVSDQSQEFGTPSGFPMSVTTCCLPRCALAGGESRRVGAEPQPRYSDRGYWIPVGNLHLLHHV